MSSKVKDMDRLMIIARTYYYLKGAFTSQELYDFILSNKFGFHSEPSVRGIGVVLSRSSNFTSTEMRKNKKLFEAT